MATLETSRLVLRPFDAADAPAVQRELSERAVTLQTLTIPYPYPDGAAAEWIARHGEWYVARKQAIWGITELGRVVGAMGLRLVMDHRRAEVGYWIAKSAWGRGIATEALRAVLAHAFDVLALHRVEGQHYLENPASGRVMEKAGMRREGLLRGYVIKDGVPRDNVLYAILRDDPRP